MDGRILVVDDDRLIRELIVDALSPEGFRVSTAASAVQALERMRQDGAPDLVVTDLSMREMDGLQLLEQVKSSFPTTDVIILTGYASLESALQAMRLGAADYLRKPVREAEVVYGVKRTMLRRRLQQENTSLRSCVQAYEAARVLGACLEPSDVLPLTLDILLRTTGRRRAVGRLRGSRGATDGVHLHGFDDGEGAQLRDRIDREKLFDPGALEGQVSDSAQEADPELGDLLALPLRVDGSVVGGVWVFPDGRSFREDEARGAELVVGQAELSLMNAERFLQAREKAFIDDVTDLYNARYLLSALDRETNRAARSDLQLSVLFLDLDRFKQVNDQHGHLVGSRVLREFGQLLFRSIRTIDTVGRYGGDEFTVLLVDTDHEGALQVAERIRETVSTTPFGAERGLRLSLTVSIGVSTFPQHGGDRDSLLDRADKAMYLGKAQGRNLVCSAEDLTPTTL